MQECSTIGELIQAYVDGQLSLDDQTLVDEHIAECPDCAMQFDEQDKTEDNGISQRAMVKKSVTTIGPAIVPNPVELRPFVTFPEISQPVQSYIFRVKKQKDQPITCALFNVAARTWEIDTINEIRDYVQANVKDVIVIS